MERPVLSVPTVEIDAKRYEELLRKEATLDRIEAQYDIDIFMSKKVNSKAGESNDG